MDRLTFGDVVDMPQPTIGAGPPGNKAVVVGFLVTHPEANEVWIAWPEEDKELKLATDHGGLTQDVIQPVLEGARAKFYKTMSTAGEMVANLMSLLSSKD